MLSVSQFLELNEARWKRTNRIRGGKVQRRKVVSTDKKFKIRKGKAEFMKSTERRVRALSQKRGARKRKAKLNRSGRKRKKTLRKRKMLGFDWWN